MAKSMKGVKVAANGKGNKSVAAVHKSGNVPGNHGSTSKY